MNITEQEYLEKRVIAQRNYFSGKAASNKRKYYFISITKLMVSLAITVLSSATGGGSPISIIIAVLSALLNLTEGILLLCKYNENWITYRITSENLKKEEVLFKARAGEYYNTDSSQALNIFIQNIEAVIQSSNKQWESICRNKKGEN